MRNEAAMIELYDFELFASPAKVRLHLAEKGLSWTRRRVDIMNLDHKREAYLALNPAGLVPTLRHDEALLVEADVIMEYIEDTFPGPTLRPADTYERAWMRLWLKTIEQMHDAYSVTFQDQIALHRTLDGHGHCRGRCGAGAGHHRFRVRPDGRPACGHHLADG
jgi:glutathione S-transferase